MDALELVAVLPGADVLRHAVVGERALGRRAFALAGADGQRLVQGLGRTVTTTSGARRALTARKANRPKQSENVICETPTGKTPTCGQANGVVAFRHAEKPGGKRKIALPAAGQLDLQRQAARWARAGRSARAGDTGGTCRRARLPALDAAAPPGRRVRRSSTQSSDSAQQNSAAAPSRKAPALPTDSAVKSISAPKSSV